MTGKTEEIFCVFKKDKKVFSGKKTNVMDI